MKYQSWPYALLISAFLLALAGLVLSVYQSVDVWLQVLSGQRFEGLTGPESTFQYVLFFAMLFTPLALALFAMRRWQLRPRGFVLVATACASAFPIYAAICVVVLYHYAA